MRFSVQPIKSISILALITVIMTGMFAAPSWAEPLNKAQLPAKTVAVIHCDYPPVSFWNKSNNSPSGFFVDIMDVISKRSGLLVTYVCENNWSKMLSAVESGKGDLSVLMKSAEREKRLLFTTPIEMTYLAFFARAQSRIDDEKAPEGSIVGVVQGGMSSEQLKSWPGIVLHKQDSFQHGIFSLLAGEIDLFAGEEAMILKQARETGLEDRIRKVGKSYLERQRCIAVRKTDAALLARLNSALSGFIGSPEYQEIYLRWYGKPTPYWTVKRLMTVGSILFFLSLCGMAAWRYRSISRLNEALMRSIIERKRAEEVVAASEARQRQITENMVDMVGQFDNRAVFQYASPSYERILGYCTEELVGRSAIDLIHPDDRDQVIRSIDAMLRSDAGSAQFRYRHKNGSYRWIESTGRNITNEQGTVTGSILGSRDITERKRAEQALRTSEEMTRSVLDSVDEGFIVVDGDYRILTANRAYSTMVAASCDAVVGRHCYEVSHRIDRPCHQAGEDCAVQRAFESGEPCVANHTHHDADGQRLYVETKAFPLRNEAGIITSAIESVTNITEKHLLDQERLKTQKLEAIGTLAGGIAHDFNNLLQGVFGYISLARLQCDNKEKGIAALMEAEKALHLSVKLTNQLLTFSKGGKPVKKTIDLRPTVANAVNFALSGSRSGCRIMSDDLWLANADEGQIAQVIQNIVLNADQAMPEGGHITISMRNIEAPNKELPQGLSPGKYVEIAIADTGIGIAEHYATRIFDPYFTTKEKGSGLGLATSYSIVRNHNGLITMRSDLGKGTTFFVYLPVTGEECRESPAMPVPKAVSGRKGRVLVMDDEQIIRDVAGELIRTLGHDVDFAIHGEEALAKYETAQRSGIPFDVVILDLTIRGGMGGAETMRNLTKLDPAVKAVVSSGYSDDSITANHLDRGFRAFLKKPYNVDELQGTLDELLKA